MKLLSLLAFAFGLPSLLLSQEAAPRTALLIGVGDYGEGKFKGSDIADLPGITDADLPSMEAKLKILGFTVTVLRDPMLPQARRAVEDFTASLRTQAASSAGKALGSVGLFYFSGHGAENQGKHYLIPKGAYLPTADDLEHAALATQTVVNQMEASGTKVCLSFLDCCRSDLGKDLGSAAQTPLEAKGSFIGYATRSGEKADPEAQGSPYTRFLLKHLDKPGISVADMYGYVVKDVKEYTQQKLGEERRPGFYSELEGEPFYFVPASLAQSTPAMSEAEIERRARVQAAQMIPPPASVPSLPPVPDLSVHTTNKSSLDSGSIGKVIQMKLPGGVLMKFCYCPVGNFMMGSPASEKERGDDENQVPVRISKAFWMAQTEVTQGQWKSLMENNPSTFKGDELPVETIRWEDAQVFLTKLNQTLSLPVGWQYALPTEAQWEYACRAGTESVFSFGNVLNGKEANGSGYFPYGTGTKGGNLGKTCAVASYAPNAWGLHDMHGNVWEWCSDLKSAELPGGTDPIGTAKGAAQHVVRGGSWYGFAAYCRSANRDSFAEGYRDYDLGFRPVLVSSSR